MFDTPITIVGNVLTAPEWRRTRTTNTLVLNFKIASTSRKMDRETGQWVDGPSLRVRVTCWRRLAENVAGSVVLGDPLVVYGRMFTREWTDDDGGRHLAYEVEAAAVGHDLSRGIAHFSRRRGATSTDVDALDDETPDLPLDQGGSGDERGSGDEAADTHEPDLEDAEPELRSGIGIPVLAG
jgi:single-strand DNA-binding protein